MFCRIFSNIKLRKILCFEGILFKTLQGKIITIIIQLRNADNVCIGLYILLKQQSELDYLGFKLTVYLLISFYILV